MCIQDLHPWLNHCQTIYMGQLLICWNQSNSKLWCSSVKTCILHIAWRKNVFRHLLIHTHLARIVKTRFAELPEVIPLIWFISVGSLNINVGCKPVWALWDTKLEEKKNRVKIHWGCRRVRKVTTRKKQEKGHLWKCSVLWDCLQQCLLQYLERAIRFPFDSLDEYS